ncbi:MAG: DUF4389 domain-containing protein [Rhizobiales bacterium]|nr:DUF4389 domain-containing protein [Hyphomicrobiales bacterium]
MSDTSASANGEHGDEKKTAGDAPEILTSERKELFFRFLFMLAFWFLGYIAFSLSILLGAVQLVVILIKGSKNDELAAFSRNLIQYVWQCLAFISFATDEKPFPLGTFPKV